MKTNKKLIKGLIIVIVCFSSFKLNAQLADTPWPMFQHDPQLTGKSPYIGSDSVQLIWTRETSHAIENQPAIGPDGTIYTCAYRGGLFALRPDGSIKWYFEIDDPGYHGFTTTPALSANGMIFIAGGDPDGASALYAIDQDGKLKWKYVLSKMGYVVVYSSPALTYDGTIYIGTMEDTLYAINPEGATKWKFGLPDGIDSSPAIGLDQTIYIGCKDGYLYAIRPNGTFKWKYQKGESDDPVSPVIDSNGIIYITGGHKLHALNPNGSLKWVITDNDYRGTPAIAPNGTIYCLAGPVFNNADLIAINPNGNIKWDLLDKYSSAFLELSFEKTMLTDAVGNVYCTTSRLSNSHKLYAIDSTGTIKWSYTTGVENKDIIWSGPVLDASGTIYFGTGDYMSYGKLYVLASVTTGQAPDLYIDGIQFDPIDGTNTGARLNITALVKDRTGNASAHARVAFYHNYQSNLIDTVQVWVPTGGPGYAQISWDTQNYPPGLYQIIAKVYRSQPTESDTSNNEMQIEYPIYPTIQSRINAAHARDTVWVEPGTYFENIRLKDDVVVKSKMGPEKTILNGKGVASTVTAEWLQNSATLEGFTITNGKGAPYGGGVYIYRGGATIRGNVIKNNSAAQGGGIYIIGIINPSYPNNPLIFQNIITGNDADRGEAILTNNSQSRIWNNTVVANGEKVNGQRTGDGIWSEGVYYPTPDIRNCIIWDNGDDMTGNPYAGGALATYSCIEDGDSGEGNISQNPHFVDPENGDFHLQPNSPCINSGDPNPIFNDQDGSRNDMGAYGGSYSVLTGIKESNEADEILPNSFHLFQNYPNPFNPSTAIKFTAPKSSEVELSIFNIQGQLIKTLLNKKINEGFHSVIWDGLDSQGKQVGSGLYIYRLSTPEFQKSNKMLLIR